MKLSDYWREDHAELTIISDTRFRYLELVTILSARPSSCNISISLMKSLVGNAPRGIMTLFLVYMGAYIRQQNNTGVWPLSIFLSLVMW